MIATRVAIAVVEGEEVVAVVRDDCPCFALDVFQELVVGEAAKLGKLVYREDVMGTVAELLRDDGRQHLVEQEPHARALRSRRQSSSATSASSTWRRIRSSISSRYSP